MRLPQSILAPFSTRVCSIIAVTCFATVSLCVGAAVQQLTCAPSTLLFGSVVIGQSESEVVSLSNGGPTRSNLLPELAQRPSTASASPGMPRTLRATTFIAASPSGTYAKINPGLDANTAYTDSGVAAGQTYYYEPTAVNSAGQEGVRSTPPVAAAIP